MDLTTKKYSLGILQNHTTQFDAPLYRLMAKEPDLDLTVYYHCQQPGSQPIDPEINRPPEWDHDVFSSISAVYAGRSLLDKLRFINKIVSARHDLVIICGYSHVVTSLTTLLCRLKGVPTGLRSDNILTDDRAQGLMKGVAKRVLYPLIFRMYSVGHPVGTLAENYLLDYGFEPDRLFRFPYAVDNDYLKNLCARYRENRVELRQNMGIRENDLVVLGIAKFHHREDPLTLLSGFAIVSKEVSGLHLVLIGDGPLRSEIDLFIRERDVQNVHLPGYMPYSKLPLYFAISDIFVHPAQRECWGVSVQEALACGVPTIVAESVGAGYDLVRDQDTGFVFKTGDPESLAVAMERLIYDPKLRQKFSTSAQRVAHCWNYQATIDSIRAALKAVSGD